ncbi:hypothetical protein NMY22_g12829 [Coprinellus aureogranulatus]|nr:hypothetical protein NMY22_g12829 [Coprinellus aureogranulatus]
MSFHPTDTASRRSWLEVRGCISISIARGSILEVMLAAPHAGQQNMFTSSRFYSAHPKEIGKYESLKTDIPMASVPRRVPSSFAVMADNMEWPTAKGVACGLHCPASQRKTADDKGMASFRYTKRYEHAIPQSRVAGTDYLLAQSSLVFRLCIRCRNKDCANYSPARESYKRMEIL